MRRGRAGAPSSPRRPGKASLAQVSRSNLPAMAWEREELTR